MQGQDHFLFQYWGHFKLPCGVGAIITVKVSEPSWRVQNQPCQQWEFNLIIWNCWQTKMPLFEKKLQSKRPHSNKIPNIKRQFHHKENLTGKDHTGSLMQPKIGHMTKVTSLIHIKTLLHNWFDRWNSLQMLSLSACTQPKSLHKAIPPQVLNSNKVLQCSHLNYPTKNGRQLTSLTRQCSPDIWSHIEVSFIASINTKNHKHNLLKKCIFWYQNYTQQPTVIL